MRMRRKSMFPLLVLLFVSSSTALFAAQPGVTTQTVRLWENDAPLAMGKADKDIPTLTVYRPEKPNGTAMVICPGGAYVALSVQEGRDYALYLNKFGVTGFVLKYRLGGAKGYHHPAMLFDAARAVRLIRARCGEWGVAPNKIGIMGSSAGGHLASTLLTHFDAGKPEDTDPVERASSRPDFGVLCYAVISMLENTHGGSRGNLLGSKPDPQLIESLSNEKQVTPQTPPCFIWHTLSDPAVRVENSLDFAMVLKRNGVPFDLHIYQNGKHGIGLASKYPFDRPHPWAVDLVFWMKENGWVK